jgi:hypothetical protein
VRNIKIDFDEVYRYLGCRGKASDKALEELTRAAALVLETARPKHVARLCTVERGGTLRLSGTSFLLTGRAISELLRESGECFIFCATLGNGVDALIRRWELKDMAFAMTLDACASSAVESLCNNIESELREDARARGLYLTDRFSPGYEDLPLELQKPFCADLDTARKIGVTVTDSGLLLPRKSVTALIGISDRPQKHRDAGCESCTALKACKFRKDGVTCYGHIL